MTVTLEELAKRVAALEAKMAAGAAAFGGGPAGRHPDVGQVADDAELDSKFGDPVIKRDPTEKYWKGPSFVGKPLSRTTPEYCDAFAKYREACAFISEKEGTPDKVKYAGYDRKDAARARGWAARLRAQQVAAPTPKASAGVDDPYAPRDDGEIDDIPFIVNMTLYGGMRP